MKILFIFLLLLELIHHETSLNEQPFVEKTLPEYCGPISQEEFPSGADARRDQALKSCPASTQ